jgi:hypothetical protein
MLKKFASVSSADGHAERDRRDVQALIPSVSLFPPSRISRAAILQEGSPLAPHMHKHPGSRGPAKFFAAD